MMDRILKAEVHAPVAGANTLCGGRYTIVGLGDPSSDREVVLTTLPVLGHERVSLAGPLRDALWVRLKAALGPLDVVATHLASGSDDRPCDASTCRPPCRVADSLKTCQGREAAALLDHRRAPESVGILMGDLNAKPGDATISALASLHYIDTFVAAGNPPCDATTGTGCTSGREDTDLSDLTNPSSREAERIDYVFLATKRQCRVDEDVGALRAEPESPPLDGLVFASDHTGVQAKISCLTTPGDRAAARPVKGGIDHHHDEGVRDRRGDEGSRHQVLRDGLQRRRRHQHRVEARPRSRTPTGCETRSSARYEDPSIKTLADQVRVRIDSMRARRRPATSTSCTRSSSTQATALDHLPGSAVRVGIAGWCHAHRTARSRRSATSVPEPCR